jgi:maltoporin
MQLQTQERYTVFRQRRSGVDALTASELRVTHAYAKFGISSRTELSAALAG